MAWFGVYHSYDPTQQNSSVELNRIVWSERGLSLVEAHVSKKDTMSQSNYTR